MSLLQDNLPNFVNMLRDGSIQGENLIEFEAINYVPSMAPLTPSTEDTWSAFAENWLGFLRADKNTPGLDLNLLSCLILAIEGGNPQLVPWILDYKEACEVFSNTNSLTSLRAISLHAKALGTLSSLV